MGRAAAGSKPTASRSASWPGPTAASRGRARPSGATPPSAWPTGTATACPTSSSTRSWASGLVPQRRHSRSARVSPPRSPSRSSGTAPQPALAWGWLKPDGKALLTQWRTTPVAVDWNGDGLADLVMLDHEGYLALFRACRGGGARASRAAAGVRGRSRGARFASTRGRRQERPAQALRRRLGRRRQARPPAQRRQRGFFRQLGDEDGPWIFSDAGPVGLTNIEGHDVSPTVVDFNGDGVPDFLGGAEDGRFYLLKNPRASR